MRRNRLISTGAAGLLCGLAALAALAFGAPKKPPADPPSGNGQVQISLSKGSDVLDLPNAVIGDRKTGSVVVSNGGKLAADFKLAGHLVTPQSARPLANQLRLVVSKTQGGSTTQLFSGSAAGFNAASAFALGTLYPRQGGRSPNNMTLNFQLSFPTTGTNVGDNALQNLGPIDQRFRIDATQLTGNDGGNAKKSSGGTAPTTVSPTTTSPTTASPTTASLTDPSGGNGSPNDLGFANLPAGFGNPVTGADDAPRGKGAVAGAKAASQTPNASGTTASGSGGQPSDDAGLPGGVILLGLLGFSTAGIVLWGLGFPGRLA